MATNTQRVCVAVILEGGTARFFPNVVFLIDPMVIDIYKRDLILVFSLATVWRIKVPVLDLSA